MVVDIIRIILSILIIVYCIHLMIKNKKNPPKVCQKMKRRDMNIGASFTLLMFLFTSVIIWFLSPGEKILEKTIVSISLIVFYIVMNIVLIVQTKKEKILGENEEEKISGKWHIALSAITFLLVITFLIFLLKTSAVYNVG